MTEHFDERPRLRRAGVLNMGTLLAIIGVAATLATILFPEFVNHKSNLSTTVAQVTGNN